jgi:hypothetical protein
MSKKNLNNKLLKIYGISNNSSKTIHKKILANTRISSFFIKKKHQNIIEDIKMNILTERLLKTREDSFIVFKKKVITYNKIIKKLNVKEKKIYKKSKKTNK